MEEEAADASKKRKKKEDPFESRPTPPPPSPSLQDQLQETDSVLHSLSKRRNDSVYTRRRLISQEQAVEQEEKEQTSLLLQHHQKENQESTRGMLPPSPGRKQDESSNELLIQSTPGRLHEVERGNRHLGMTAATHLEQLGRALLDSDAPLLWKELSQRPDGNELKRHWINKIMSLATRCCGTVEPNVKKGDLLDIRPYCKIKGKSGFATSIMIYCSKTPH